MTTIETTLTEEKAEALRILTEIVEEKGADYVYPDSEKKGGDICQYLTYDEHGNPTGPSCLVGHYLVRTGMPMSDLVQYEGTNINDTFDLDLPHWLVEALAWAQRAQDRGDTWGKALEVFEERVHRPTSTRFSVAVPLV